MLKTLRNKTYNVWRKHFGSFDLVDIRETASRSPYTYYLPSKDRIDAIEVNDLVKLVIRSVPKSYQYNAERMWVRVQYVSDEAIRGSLDNVPFDIPQLTLNDTIAFKPWHIIDIQWNEPDKEKKFPPAPSKQVWDRCFVDREVLNGQARVGFIYREEPDMEREGDKYPDSGWRIRADVRDLTDEQYENPNPTYIALGKVLNRDDSWIHLLDSEIGSRYLRNPETDVFEPTD